ncbi:uncharacterized protein LOC143912732 [Arctopsyche grandis]|uniref:uncharacterized protein LOC143912732 n=1 Tax=Arctopsyche grandis TaxID=121162 RepID=UPI00406D8952
MGNAGYSIVWLIILIFVTFWLAGFCAFFYIILLPFTACFDFLQPLADLLLQGIQTPLACTKAMMEGRPLMS